MNVEQAHNELYSRILPVNCKNCGKCCGPVEFSAWEWNRQEVKRKASPESIAEFTKMLNGQEYNPDKLNCPYRINGKCSIYETRPFICRLFGSAENLRCPNGCGPIKLMSEAQAQELTREYIKILKL